MEEAGVREAGVPGWGQRAWSGAVPLEEVPDGAGSAMTCKTRESGYRLCCH